MNPEGPDYESQPLRCFACEVRESAAAAFVEDGGAPHGLFMGLTKKGET